MVEIDDLIKRTLEECEEDYVGLWTIFWRIRREDTEVDDTALASILRHIIIKLLSEPNIRVGKYVPLRPGAVMLVFECWDVDVDVAVERILGEWNDLGRDPIGGEIAWFVVQEGCERFSNQS